MPISSAEHAEIERMVNSLSGDALREMKSTAENMLHQINAQHSRKLLDKADSKAADFAIELLVRLECRENGGGWFFRAKRRVRLVQTYFGTGSATASFAISADINDFAVRLKTLTDLVVSKYISLPPRSLEQAISADFGADWSSIDATHAVFAFKDVPQFTFTLGGVDKEASARFLTVQGKGELAGYNLHGYDGAKHWFSATRNNMSYDATGAAKTLAKTMQSKFGIVDQGTSGP